MVLVSPPSKTAHHEPEFLSAITISSVRGCPLSMFGEHPNCPWGCHLLRCAVQQRLLAAANGKHTQHTQRPVHTASALTWSTAYLHLTAGPHYLLQNGGPLVVGVQEVLVHATEGGGRLSLPGGRGSLLGWGSPGILLQLLDLFTQRSHVLEREVSAITESRRTSTGLC